MTRHGRGRICWELPKRKFTFCRRRTRLKWTWQCWRGANTRSCRLEHIRSGQLTSQAALPRTTHNTPDQAAPSSKDVPQKTTSCLSGLLCPSAKRYRTRSCKPHSASCTGYMCCICSYKSHSSTYSVLALVNPFVLHMYYIFSQLPLSPFCKTTFLKEI